MMKSLLFLLLICSSAPCFYQTSIHHNTPVNIKVVDAPLPKLLGPLAPSGLKTSYLESPIGLDDTNPRFIWLLNHQVRGMRQAAYQLQVSNKSDFSTIQWDTKQVKSSLNAQVYLGPQLVSDTSYFWRVCWFDNNMQQSPWSEIATFDTGLYSPKDWVGKWVGTSHDQPARNLVRKEFTLSKVPSRARAFISGLGYYELYINGKKVGDARLDSGWTNQDVRVLYNVFDVTSMLKQGTNAIGVMLGHGWYSADFSAHDSPGSPPQPGQPFNPLSLLFQLSADNNVVVASDNSWFTTFGPIQFDHIYRGESYDARKEKGDWTNTGYSQDSTWVQIQAPNPLPKGALSYQNMPPVRVLAEIKAISVTKVKSEPTNHTYVFDFGQNFSGWCRLTITGAAGTKVFLRHAEALNPNGDGTILTTNLRSALASDSYVLKGTGVEVWEPRFTVHGFRYAEFYSSDSQVPKMDTLLGIHAASDVPMTGHISFTASSDILNKIQHNVVWSQKTNLMSVPTDCPQRDERKGWMGDANLSAEEALHNFYMPAFYNHYTKLIQDAQGGDGSLPETVPYITPFGSTQSDPAWGAAYITLVYQMWRYHADKDLVQSHYPFVKKWVDKLATYTDPASLNKWHGCNQYGDWCSVIGTAAEVTSSFSYITAAMQLSEMAGALGNTQDQNTYSNLATKLKGGFNSAFLDRGAMHYEKGTQTAMSLALIMGLVPQDAISNITTNFLNDIVTTHDTHLTTGIIGAKNIMLQLHAMGRDDIALRLAENIDYPSWGYMAVHPYEPATTLWELWDSPTHPDQKSMDSRNHIMFGSVSDWFYKALAGIDHEAGDYGFGNFYISPSVVGDLLSVNASFTASYGPISVYWSRNGGSRICGTAAENYFVKLDCDDIQSDGVISEIEFASFGTPYGTCGEYGVDPSCHASESMEHVKKACIGKKSCNIHAIEANLNSSCSKFKRMHVQAICSKQALTGFTMKVDIPVGSQATVKLPVLELSNVVVSESSTQLWAKGQYVPGVAGITAASRVNNRIEVRVGSGKYSFEMTGDAASPVCLSQAEGSTMNINCPNPNQIITLVNFADYGNPEGACGSYQRGSCTSGIVKSLVENSCLYKNACSLTVGGGNYPDPCFGISKDLTVQVTCAAI